MLTTAFLGSGSSNSISVTMDTGEGDYPGEVDGYLTGPGNTRVSFDKHGDR